MIQIKYHTRILIALFLTSKTTKITSDELTCKRPTIFSSQKDILPPSLLNTKTRLYFLHKKIFYLHPSSTPKRFVLLYFDYI